MSPAELAQAFLLASLVVLGMMTALWLFSLVIRDASIVDIFWGLGFILANWTYYQNTPHGLPARKILISLLVTIWGLRLALYILRRNWGRGEDFRYRQWRENAGKSWWWRSFFKVFLFQGVLICLIASPLLAGQASPYPHRLICIDYIGLGLWGIGFIFEAVGDWQMGRFRRDPANRGKVLQSGLWRYTRHPNYFGDSVQWWSFYLFALSAGAWWTIFSPILITLLLVRVSGVRMLEKSLAANKPEYLEYIRKTPAFIPCFKPRK